MRVVRKITYEGTDKRVREVVDHSLPDGACPHGGDDIKITCETLEGAPPDPEQDEVRGHTFGDRRKVSDINRAMWELGDDTADANSKRLYVIEQMLQHFCRQCGAPQRSTNCTCLVKGK